MDGPSSFAQPTYRQRRPRSFVFPILLVVAGVVLLLNNLGILPWSLWTAVGQLWPALLILLGIDLLVGRRSAWAGGLFAGLAFLAILAIAVWMTSTGFARNTPTAAFGPQDASMPLNGATSGRVAVHFGAGELSIGALPADATDLAQETATLPVGMRLNQSSTVRGNVANATIGTEGTGSGWFRNFGQNGNVSLNAKLNRQIPLTLSADVGAGQTDFDLTNLMVREFTLNNGAGQATIHFPGNGGQTSADIHSGAGQLVLIIPPGVGASIHGANGLVTLHVPSDRFQHVDDTYQTSDFASATNRVDVTLHVGIGEVDVQ